MNGKRIESDGAMWLSVDPLADNYPFLSPYVYGACNPVVLVDVDGRFFDDIFRNTKTGEVTIIKTSDPYDREFVDGRFIGFHEQGWGQGTYQNARIFDLNLPSWEQSYLSLDGEIVGLAAWKSGLIWGPEDDVETDAMTIYLGIIDFSGCGEDCYAFYQTFGTNYDPKNPGFAGFKFDGNSRGIYPDERVTTAMKNETGIMFDLFMGDSPQRKEFSRRDFYWKANTSIMYKRGEKNYDLLTLDWGFGRKGDRVYRLPARVAINPSEFHEKNMPREGLLDPRDK